MPQTSSSSDTATAVSPSGVLTKLRRVGTGREHSLLLRVHPESHIFVLSSSSVSIFNLLSLALAWVRVE